MPNNDQIVSFDDEKLILVDADDNILGYEEKLAAHMGKGMLHRAFSIFIFNSKKQLLLQQRSADKLLWPLIWSNSCCSHPRKGETDENAAYRRLREELGLETKLTYLFKFIYQAQFKDIGSEHELCSVYIGKSDVQIAINPNEIAGWEYFDIDVINVMFEQEPDKYSPWFKMEWQRIQAEFMNQVDSLFK